MGVAKKMVTIAMSLIVSSAIVPSLLQPTIVLSAERNSSATAQAQPLTKEERSIVIQLNKHGLQLYQQGQYRSALEKLQQILKMVVGGRDRSEEGTTLNNIGLVYNSLGQYGKALEFCQQALVMSRAIGDRAGAGITLSNIGLVYNSLGQYSKALDYHQQSLVISKEIGDRSGAGKTLNNIGAIYRSLGQHSKALEYYQQALLISKEVGDRSGAGKTLNNIGLAYNSLSQYSKALEYYQQALLIGKEVGDRSGAGKTLNNIGLAYNSLGQYSKALEYYQQALLIGKEVGDRSGEGITLTNIGSVLIALKQFSAAEKPLNEAIAVFESLRPGLSDRDKISLSDVQREAYKWLQEALVAQTKIAPALEIAERSRGRALVELLASRSTASTPKPQPLSISQIQQVAKQHNATLVQYSHVGKELYIWVVSSNGSISFRNVPNQSQNVTIAQLTESTRGAVPTELRPALIGVANRGEAFISVTQGSGEVTKKTDSALRQLHQRLIEPIADLLPKNDRDRVIFLPQGQLFFVPFAALIDSNGKYLIEKHTISIAPSIATLQLTAEKHNTGKNTKQNALVIGNPIMPTLANGLLKPLPGAESEAKEIALLLNTKALIGAAATKSNVVKQMQNASIIHLATHGLLDSVKGDIPGSIALTPDNPNEVGNGLLTANELFDLKLNANLVVLSACDTAKGDITGDGVVGLSRSLIAAGVPSIVVSLWSVNDNSTSFLMKDFYRNLGTMDKAQALRQAMLKTMRQPQYQKPYFWSAFTLIGEAE